MLPAPPAAHTLPRRARAPPTRADPNSPDTTWRLRAPRLERLRTSSGALGAGPSSGAPTKSTEWARSSAERLLGPAVQIPAVMASGFGSWEAAGDAVYRSALAPLPSGNPLSQFPRGPAASDEPELVVWKRQEVRCQPLFRTGSGPACTARYTPACIAAAQVLRLTRWGPRTVGAPERRRRRVARTTGEHLHPIAPGRSMRCMFAGWAATGVCSSLRISRVPPSPPQSTVRMKVPRALEDIFTSVERVCFCANEAPRRPLRAATRPCRVRACAPAHPARAP